MLITVTGEELMRLNPNNLLQALQFFDAGFRIVENNSRGSDPNALPEFRLRGDAQLGSVEPSDMQMLMGDYSNRPNMPLFILDGFEASLQRIVDLDPERVASITILKDASATAIYGSRAANGVIVFETKSPLPGAINIAYSMNLGISTPDLSDYNLMNAAEKLEYERRAGLFPEGNIPQLNYYNHYREEILRGVDTYWLSAPVRTAVTHRHTISMQGGDNALRYNLSANYGSQPGVMKQSNRTNMGISLDLQYRRKGWNISNQISLSDTKGNNTSYGSFSDYTRMNQYYRKRDADGNYTKFIENKSLGAGQDRARIFNPLYNTQFPHKDFSKNFNVTDNLNIEWAPFDNLRFSAGASLTKGTARSEKFVSMNNTAYEYEDDLTKRGSYTKNTGETLAWNANASVNYNLVAGAHVLSAFARWNVDESQGSAVNLTATGFPNDTMQDFLFGFEMNQRPGGGETTTRSMGVIGQLSYMYDYRYAVDFSIRGDISSQFGADTGMAPFWAAGVRWNVDREKWMDGSPFTSLVLRASLGVTGSQNYSPYQALE
ncbi:TonB-dependent receptor plug domain-containing protein, partial [Alistipes sp. OttesenSCG-928-B03]|nr:TonB-dependent receptor plug domain-containing protein [Alistipes sp. OttesenSCG-928-B03]